MGGCPACSGVMVQIAYRLKRTGHFVLTLSVSLRRILAKTPIPPTVRFLLATLFANAICFGIIVPVTPALVMQLGGGGLRHATVVGGWLAFGFAAFQFIFSPIMGNLSDAIGRRPVLLASLAGFAVEFWVMALAPSLAWLFVARMLSGIFGASNAPAQSSIADISSPEERARYFSLFGAAFGVGFVIGPAIGGTLGEIGPRIPFVTAAGLVTVNLICGFMFCRETLDPANRRPFDWRRANPLGALLQARRLGGLLSLALVYFLWQLATLVYPMIWPYFTMARWHWTPGVIGASLAGVGLFMAAMNLFVSPRLIPKYGERRTSLIGMSGSGLAMLLFAFAPSGWMGFALLPFMACQAFVHPALTALFSRRGTAATQGEIQGFATSTMALGSLVAPAIYFPLQNYFTGPKAPVQFDGAGMLAAALFGALALIIMALRRD